MSFEDNNFRQLKATDPARQREIARAGGIASGKAKRQKRDQQAYYSALLDASFSTEFASEDELKAFRYYRKNKDYIKEFRRYRKQFIKWYNAEQAKRKSRTQGKAPAAE